MLVPVADDGVHRCVRDERRDPLTLVHGQLRRHGGRDRTHEATDLVLTDGPEGVDAKGVEEVEGADLAELLPPVVVGCENEGLGAPPRNTRCSIGPTWSSQRRSVMTHEQAVALHEVLQGEVRWSELLKTTPEQVMGLDGELARGRVLRREDVCFRPQWIKETT